MVAPAPALQAAAGPRAARRRSALRRAALPLELQLPRRCEPSRGAGGRSGAARPRRARAHRPRRLLRRGPLRRSRREVGLPTVFGAELTLGATDAAERRRRPDGRTPDRARAPGPTATRGSAARSATRRWRGRRARRVLRSQRSPTRTHERRRPRATGGCSPAAAKARCAPRSSSAARPQPSASCSASSTRSAVIAWRSSCGITVTRSTRRATTRSPRSPSAPASTASPRTTCTTPHPLARPLATALAAVRARRSLDEIDRLAPGGAGAHLRSGAEQARRFARYPGVVEAAAELGRECAFDLALVAPDLPPFPCPPRPRRDELAARAHLARARRVATASAAPSVCPAPTPRSSTSST